jgi:hypothetical protein
VRKAAFALLLTACLVSAESAGARVVATLHPARAALQQGPSLEAIRALDVDGRQLAVATARTREFGVEADRVTVYDLERRAARYEVEIPPRSPLISLDVGSGGSLAVDTGAGGTQCQDTVTIHGPAGAETGRVRACRVVAELADETIVVIPAVSVARSSRWQPAQRPAGHSSGSAEWC